MSAEQLVSALLYVVFGVSWTNVLLSLGLAYLVFLVWRMHRGTGRFDFDDLFLNDSGKADLYKLILVVMAALSCWTIVSLVNSDKPIETLLLGVLTIFVGGRAVNAIWGPKAPDAQPPDAPPGGVK